MLGLFDAIKDHFKAKPNSHCIDNFVFKLQYRVTSVIFFIASILVTSRELIGEHIKCINDMQDSGFEKVIETFCFFTTTFTVIEDQNDDEFRYGQFGHPGISAYGVNSKKAIRRHTYYQWVPFLLFGQAIMFYLPHLLWKKFEDRRIERIVLGVNCSRVELSDKEENVEEETVPRDHKKRARVRKIKDAFMRRISLNKSWAKLFVFCEVLNLLNVLLQFYLTHRFLGGRFFDLGPNLIGNGSKVLDEIFPKVTKCTFHKYGSSGSIQVHDALCVLALNVVNEKIYVFLWFWFIVLFAASCMIAIWRILTFILYSRSTRFNQFVFGSALRGRIRSWYVRTVVQRCTYSEWLLLRYLSKNMDGLAFRDLFVEISLTVEENKPLFTNSRRQKPVMFADMYKFH